MAGREFESSMGGMALPFFTIGHSTRSIRDVLLAAVAPLAQQHLTRRHPYLTSTFSVCPHFGHLNVRSSTPGSRGSITEIAIVIPQFGQGGFLAAFGSAIGRPRINPRAPM
jgi:hypothetical protein